VIRANLLPRSKESFALFGFDVDAGYIRQVLLGISVVVVIALAGAGIESLRLQRYQAASAQAEAVLGGNAVQRSAAKRIALDVAHYQEIAREAAAVRDSGPLVASSIARVGNSVPPGVWLDSLAHTAAGFELNGESRSVDALGRALATLGSASPSGAVSLLSIEGRSRESNAGITFVARISETTAPSDGR
jgi:Tfp pilus assembly protein PilN